MPQLPGEGSRLRRWNRIRLLRKLPKGSVGAEIGVWRGDFSSQILQTVRPRTLFLIDPWRARTEARYAEAAWGAVRAGQDLLDGVFTAVCQRFQAEIHSGVVSVMRLDSAEAALELQDRSLDWVYVDGDHFYEQVRHDLESFAAKIKEAGAVTGDDYNSPGFWGEGVRRAVDEFVDRGGWNLQLEA